MSHWPTAMPSWLLGPLIASHTEIKPTEEEKRANSGAPGGRGRLGVRLAVSAQVMVLGLWHQAPCQALSPLGMPLSLSPCPSHENK